MIDIPPEYFNQIITGDARELAQRIPDESVDLILCDPVYWEIDDYRWVAQLGKRILKSYRYCIAQTGAYWFIDTINAMAESLDYYWLIQENLTYAAAFFDRKIAQLSKPYLWFSKGIEHCPDWRGYALDRLTSPKDKNHHEWGDGEGSYIPIVDRLVPIGGIVVDPFTGGGTVPAVCKMLGRNYIAFEIDPLTAERARDRVRNTQPPLFVLQPEQQVMNL